jgi:tetraacyldisaccharide 4'-kinase
LLDDGFQHRRAERDLDIVCIDATNPFGNGEILPAGILRERPQNLHRADAVVITRSNLVGEISNLKSQISNLAPESRIFSAANKITGLVRSSCFSKPPKGGIPGAGTSNETRPAFAFCGIGNPSNFFRQLEIDGFNIVGRQAFRDHYYYGQADVSLIEKEARIAGADILVTTAKDAARSGALEFSMEWYATEIEMKIEGEAGFRELICSF